MSEPDDRLVGDPVWELFPDPSTGHEVRRSRRYMSWLAVAIPIVVGWFLNSSSSIFTGGCRGHGGLPALRHSRGPDG